jgi:hypothetical protein
MFRKLLGVVVLLSSFAAAVPTLAEGLSWQRVGHGRIFNNDALDDNLDRWQTGGMAASWVFARGGDHALPAAPGQMVELRFSGRAIAPANIVAPGVDRLYAGILSLGAHTHYRTRGWDVALGLDLVATGPQTGVDDFQSRLHKIPGIPGLGAATKASQIADGIHPSLTVEMGREFMLGTSRVRPFIEGKAGVETLLRVGADLTFGRIGQGELLVREEVTGQRYRTVTNSGRGTAFVLGGDVAVVGESVFFPAASPVTMEESRTRLRAGFHWQGERNAAFYGLTWLSEEFVGQTEGQLIGSFRLDFRF